MQSFFARVGVVGLLSAFILTACNFSPWQQKMPRSDAGPQSSVLPQRPKIDYRALVQNEQEYLQIALPLQREMLTTTGLLEQKTADQELVSAARRQETVLTENIQALQTILDAVYPSAPEHRSGYTPILGDTANLTGRDFEVAVVDGLIAQHEATIEVSQVVLEQEISEETQTLAEDMIQNSQEEIEILKDWFGSRDAKTIPVSNPE